MSLAHWQLRRSPFGANIDPERCYPSEALNEALARIEYLVDQRRRTGVLLGDRGLGKSAALAVAKYRLAKAGAAVAVVDAVGLGRRELLWQVAEGIQATPDPLDDEARLWRRLSDRLRHNKWQARSTVLLVDDVDQLGADLVHRLVRLLRLDPEADARWTVIMATMPDRLAQMDDALLHAIDLRIDLEPWSADDSVGYIQNALVEAGRLAPVFDDQALLRLHELASGSPRHVARLADFALLAGAGAGVEEIGAELVDQAFEAISWAPPAAED